MAHKTLVPVLRRACIILCAAAGTAIAVFAFVRGNEVGKFAAAPDGLVDSMLFLAVKSRAMWLSGISGTLTVAGVGSILGFVFAVLLVFVRSSDVSWRDSAFLQTIKFAAIEMEKLYVTVIRGTPMMVQACIVYYAGFAIAKSALRDLSITEINRIWSFFTAGLITLSLNTSAYIAEVLRGGIESLEKGQKEAALALGFTPWQTMMCVVFPQVIKNSLPSLCNEVINNIKGSSVLTVIGFVELMFATDSVAGFYYEYLPSYCLSAVLYLAIILSITWILNGAVHHLGIQVFQGEN